ncbi:hypothetical protein [Chroococcidiopsis sp. TS-821]|uniref:hypothetical protein n=1 Tax=Chroococcidiopsis sp. TS-821 TaxID=1378066 RepID=UPI00143D4D6E|nr:hypothetical protein [Chroococcidiopsis sp. TS-821]
MRNLNKGWTTEQLINLSQSWAYVFPAKAAQAKAKQDAWTTEQFIRVGNKHINL